MDTFDNEYETLLDSSNHDITNTSIDDNGNQDHPLHTSHWKDYLLYDRFQNTILN